MARRAGSTAWRLLEHLPSFGWYVARAERAYAKRQCALLLEIYDHFRSEHPGLDGDGLYAQVVEYGLDCDPTAARSIVLAADRSFAQWPTERDVTLRDVASFLLMNQLLPAHSETLGVQTNVTSIVAAVVPLRL
ncbi:MAG: hypothetical protein EHM50_00470 [Lysobacterales bacterium]|nr:MAG: hypothetical protein EHM50_00470 [Xanthomonadales bacterium]